MHNNCEQFALYRISTDESPFASCNFSRRETEFASTSRRILDVVAVGTIGEYNFASARYL
jgi:hypothetical protein